jgi:hypothetical protein
MAGIVWKKNTLFNGIEIAKKDLGDKQMIALRKAIEVFKSGFGKSGGIPVVTGRLKGSLLGKLAYENKGAVETSSKDNDIVEKYEKKGASAMVTWGSNVEYALKVELTSRTHANYFTNNWETNKPKAIEVIMKALNLNSSGGINMGINKITQTGESL